MNTYHYDTHDFIQRNHSISLCYYSNEVVDGTNLQDMRTDRYPGVAEDSFCSWLSAIQVWREKMSDDLMDEMLENSGKESKTRGMVGIETHQPIILLDQPKLSVRI